MAGSKDEANVVLNFKADGAVELAKTVKELNTVMNTSAKEYRAHIAAMGDDATAADKLEAKQKKLSAQFDAAKKRTQLLTDQYETMKNSGTATSNELAKMQGKVLDAQRAESSLGNQLNKVNDELSDNGKSALDAKEKLNGLQTEGTQLEAKQKALTSAIKLENAELGDNASESEKTATSQRQLSQQIELAKKVVANLEEQLRQTKTAYGENSTEATQMAAKLDNAKTSVVDLENKLDSLGDSGKDAGDGMEELNKKVDANNLMEAGDALSGVGDKAKEMGGSVIEAAMDYSDGQAKMQASMGGTSKAAKDAMGVVKEVMSKGVVESVDEAVDAVSDVKTAFGDLDDTQLAKLTDQVTTLAKRTGSDYGDVLKSVSQLQKNMGLSGKEALNVVAKGMQDGNNRADDYLDTLDEYAPTFKDAGISAKGMVNIITKGMQAGAFNTDKVADAVKEFNLRLHSGDYSDVMKQFGKSTVAVFQEFKKGKATTKDVMEAVGKSLDGMPAGKAKKAVQDLGTQFEDLGQAPSAALLKAATGVEKIDGAAAKATKHTNSENLKGALNDLSGSFATIVEGLTPVVTGIANLIKSISSAPAPVRTLILALAGIVAGLTAIAPAVISAKGVFSALSPIITALGSGGFGILKTALTAVVSGFGGLISAIAPFMPVILAVGAAITALVLIIKNWGSISKWLEGVWNSLKETTSNAWDAIKAKITEVLNGIKSGVTGAWNAVKNATSSAWNAVKTTTSNVWNSIKSAIASVYNAIKSGIKSAWDSIKNTTKSAWNAVKSTTSSVWNSIKSAIAKVYNAIKSGVKSAWNSIKSTTSSVFNSVKSTASSTWNGIKSAISRVYNAIKSGVKSAWNAIKSTTSSVFNGIKSVATSVWNSIKNAMINPIKSAANTISGVINRIKGWFSGLHLRFPRIEMPPLPHFSLNGSFSLKPPSVPHLSVDWYAKGGIFTQPTVFANAQGGFNGYGDAGPEAALPLNEETLGGIGEGIAKAMGGRSTQPIYLQIDGRTFANIVGPYVSGYMSQQDATSGFSRGRRNF
ncbi:hypothetical protein DA798_09630 [Lactobacillus sp. PFC-70]|nr:hypothetical protein DA798_09630 [Lactobacillus sp. PFC-70]